MPASAAAETAPAPAPCLVVDGLVVERREAGRAPSRILDGVDLALAPGAVIAVTGASGAGKTTLLHAIAGLVRPAAGTVWWNAIDVTKLTEAARDRWRRAIVGLVFQEFELLPELGVLDNILLPFTFDHWAVPTKARERADRLAARVGLADRSLRVAKLSRGEQQRVAIARALVRGPALLLADEPTASLDGDTGAAIGDLLLAAAREANAALVIVSHDAALVARADSVWRLAGGRLTRTHGGRP
jgi:ABC-type lipoprotein export system ATPase subunit